MTLHSAGCFPVFQVVSPQQGDTYAGTACSLTPHPRCPQKGQRSPECVEKQSHFGVALKPAVVYHTLAKR